MKKTLLFSVVLLFSDCQSDNIKVGDTVEVYCPILSSQKFTEKVKAIEGEWYIFEGNSGKIQREWCSKIQQIP